jgi:energy-converting hydrogenase Eha subunit C
MHCCTRQIIPLHIPHLNHTLPQRRIRLAIHDLISHRLQSLRLRPLELAKVIGRGDVDANIRRLARRIGERPHSRSNYLGGARIVLKVKPLDQITILLAVAHGHVLVLLRVVFVGLDEAYAGVAGFEEGAVVAAAGVAVQTVDEAHCHFGEGVGGDFVDVAAEIAGWTVIVSADGEAGGCGCGVLSEGSTLTEEADIVGIGGAVFGFGAGDGLELDICVGRGLRTFRPCRD